MSQHEPISIAIVDDNEFIGHSVQRWLAGQAKYTFAGSFTSTKEALPAIRAGRPRVVLIDVEMPGSDSFRLVEQIAKELPGTVGVMLSGHCDRASIEKSLLAGAVGYIVKDEGIPAIMELIDRVATGLTVLSETAKASLAR